MSARRKQDEPPAGQAEQATTVEVRQRVYETLDDGRTVLAAVPGDRLPADRARQLGLAGKHGRGQVRDDIADPYLLEGIVPLTGPVADARATGDTAEAKARGGRQPTADELQAAAQVERARTRARKR